MESLPEPARAVQSPDGTGHALEKAEAAAREAAESTDVARIVAAVLATQQATQQSTTPAPAPRQEFSPTKWLVIGGVLIAGGLVASVFAVAVAIGGLSAGLLALVLRSMWRDVQKGR
ncbi:hypothetical protein ACFUMJ_08290 [Streptomyces olivaceus]|uniref:hypothetical protein n=1 Tax=Streptomyces TaxID=1883 RepID=UPI001FB83002|nr:hypothetical protein [Streptomyces sp. CB09030]UOG78354.1 hypothetical protein L6J92_03680 [Streptomyces sp. CB09030]